MLADETITRANENQNPNLYFVGDHYVTLFIMFIFLFSPSQAISGAGASFGLVAEVVFVTHLEPGPTVRYSYTFKSVIFISHSRWLSNLILLSADCGVLRFGLDLCQMAIRHLYPQP